MSSLGSEPRNWNQVGDFYAGRSIFITGASGFLGKVLIGKLLHDCPKIKNIYILLRTKGNVLSSKRLTQLLESEAFDPIRRIQPKLLEKVKIIKGDTTFDDLAISPSDVEILKKDVSIVVHSAATIRFDEPLKRATRINVTATKRVVDLALQFNNLKAFIHVSTAYCNQTKVNIRESVYPEVITPEQLMKLSEEWNDEMLESITHNLFGDRPSSYHYTKAMAENLIKTYAEKGAPIAIVRPSIITASLKDPMPGWTDNYNGPSGYLVTAGAGILRVMLVDGEKICDAIPVDIVANTIIVSAWHVANREQSKKRRTTDQQVDTDGASKEPYVVNCTSGQINPITWEEIRSLSLPWLVRYPPTQMFRYPGPRFVSNKTLHKMLVGIEHDLPTYVIDLLFKSLGRSPMLGPIYQKVHRTTQALEYFTKNEWIYRTENFEALNDQLSSEDKKRFTIDVRKINWPTYMENYVLGVRHFLLKENPASIESARHKLEVLYYLTQATKVTVAGVSGFVLYKLLSWRRNLNQ